MTTETIKGVIAFIVIVGAIASVFLNDSVAQGFLIPLASFVFGYYFNKVEKPVTMRLKAMLGKE